MTSTLRATSRTSLNAMASSFSLAASLVIALTASLSIASPASASASASELASAAIQFLPTSQTHSRSLTEANPHALAAFQTRISKFVQANVDMKKYHHVGVQTIQDAAGKNDHLVLFMHSATTHRFDLASVSLSSQEEPVSIDSNYTMQERDLAAQPYAAPICPDPSVQFIAFAPNNMALELQITQDVAKQARAAGLKTVEFYVQNATRANYLAYMSCPNIKGNFYDGDANPNLITTNDGVIQSSELANLNFNYHTTNIWLACQAFNDPILSVMLNSAKSQKYAAGQNDLRVGPSDRTAACAMNAALKGRPMTASFQQCYQALDISGDHWGFAGNGSDIFGQ